MVFPTIAIFLGVLWITMIITRLIVSVIPCINLTKYLRHKSFLYIHHIYFGIILMSLSFPFIVFNGLNVVLLIMFVVGLSLSLDEASAWIIYSDYPKKKEFIITLVLFILFSIFIYLASII